MKLLLDTHVWLWSALTPDRIADHARSVLHDRNNELWLSPISIWETLLLARKGRIILEPTPTAWLANTLNAIALQEAPLTFAVAQASEQFTTDIPDPADRFLAATAVVYGLTLVTADRRLRARREFRSLRS
ncbi:MAG: type II toxin-antitoxin system VapC family toxin [Nitrospirae bacterium]|nr:type II toxin-antitoxin system VapC family toxin [Nitrospirota bacterium]